MFNPSDLDLVHIVVLDLLKLLIEEEVNELQTYMMSLTFASEQCIYKVFSSARGTHAPEELVISYSI
jgi:hypothetical protein